MLLNGWARCHRLSKMLRSGEYVPREPYRFTLTYPKTRPCSSNGITDRVFQRALNDYAVMPIMCRSLVYDNAACQKGKGVDFARKRMRAHLQRHHREHGLNGYMLQCDIKSYYGSMPHDRALELLEAKLPIEVYRLCKMVIESQYPGDRGFDPGSQLVQILGLCFMDELDHIIKERFRIKGYGRLMDDFYLVHEDRQHLQSCREYIETWLGRYGMRLHQTKTAIRPIRCEFKYLGYMFRLTESGAVVTRLPRCKIRQRKRQLTRMAAVMPREGLLQCHESWQSHALGCSDKRAANEMDRFFDRLETK